MARDATALDLPRVSLRDFLEILWDSRDLEELALTPDASLAEIRTALSTGDLPAAWTRLAHERRLVGAVLTYLRYLSPAEREHSDDTGVFTRYAAELNGLAGIAALEIGQLWSARELWLCGLAARPDADPLRALLRDPEFERRSIARPVPEGVDAHAEAAAVAQDKLQIQRDIQRAGTNLAAAVLTDNTAAVVGFATTTIVLPSDIFVASVASGRGLPQEAIAIGTRQAVKELLPAGPSLALAESLLTLARSLRMYEDALAATDAIAMAAQVMRRIGHRRGLGRALLDLGVNFKDHRLWYDALRALELADGHFAATGDRGGLAAAAYHRATIARQLDECATALAFLEDARRLLPKVAAADGWRMQVRAEELLNLMHLDRRPAARAIIDAWIADAEGHEAAGGRPLLLSRPIAAMADIDRRDGNGNAALANYSRACAYAAREILEHRTVRFRDRERIRAAEIFDPAIRYAVEAGAADVCFGMLQLARTGSISLSRPRRRESTLATLREQTEQEERSRIVERAVEAIRTGAGLGPIQHDAEWLIGRRDFVEAAVPAPQPTPDHLESPDARARAVRERLAPGAAVVEYFWTFDALAAIVLDGYGATVHDLGLSRADMMGVVEAALAELDAAEGTAHLARLARVLIDPLDAGLASCSTLFIVPAEGLHRVPFHALERGSRPLVTTHLIRYLDRAALLAEDSPATSRVVSTSECRTIGAPSVSYSVLPFLTGVPPELHMVAALFGATPVESAAARDLLHATSADILHVACHAEAQPDTPLLSRLLFVDRPVFAFEIALSSFSAGMVVLSACDTGSGPAATGGRTDSLASAFLGAGAREVAASLWPLVDDVGPVFIERFYSDILTSGASAAEAVRNAQLTVRDIPEFRHPSFWAPFVVYGR